MSSDTTIVVGPIAYADSANFQHLSFYTDILFHLYH